MTEKQKAYLRKHDVAAVLDGIVREMLEEKPSEPFSYILTKLEEVQEKRKGGTPATKEEEPHKEEPAAEPAAEKEEESAKPEEPIDLSKLDAEDKAKIVKIQAQYRGGKGRAQAAEKRAVTKDAGGAEEKTAPEEVDPSEWSKNDKEQLVKIQVSMAIKTSLKKRGEKKRGEKQIQARYRGGKAREEVEKLKQVPP
eukprot:TRINITY_DN888_c2_g1_i1.p1 TRINITY_DN888_c2_g1~~TRINITY_DN888_c2_g1_i1.p1  ORF type:complete len:230 (+),score=80.25 TRINITY_DN888_c2_g1_i1:103-690(+)